MLRMDGCIDSLGDSTVYSTLDANWGYWQMPIAEEDRDYTKFVTHHGALRYIRSSSNYAKLHPLSNAAWTSSFLESDSRRDFPT